MATAWDAFISYARSESERTAIAVQRGLERFARPWNQRRAVRIFRDDSAMSTSPSLWSAIEDGLTAAGHLVVLLSPTAQASEYVEKEVSWWLDHKGAESILLVLDAGELGWDEPGNRFTADSAVPPCLRDAFAEEPRWLDLRWVHDSPTPAADPRFAAAMADLSAPIRGVPRDELIGEDLTQHRRVRRLATSAVSVLALLLVISIVATVVAVQQRDDVLRQAVTLRSRQLASTASGLLDSDLRLAQLVAVQGFRTEASAATRDALVQAALSSPLIDGFVPFDAAITAVATSADSSTVAVGLTDGRVYTTDGEGVLPPVLRFTVTSPVTALRASRDGAVLLAATRDGVTVWDAAGSRVLPGAGGLVSADAIALSPSGRRAAVAKDSDTVSGLVIYDTAKGAELTHRTDPLAPEPNTPVVYPQFTEHLAFLDDHRLRLVGHDASWLDLDLRTGRTRRPGSVSWTPSVNLYATSSRADFLLAAPIINGQAVRVWRLDGAGKHPAPAKAGVQLTDPLGMTVSPDGRLVLVNDSSTGLSVAPVSSSTHAPVVPATRVPGLSGVAAMEFVGPTRAVAAARTDLTFLRFGDVGRGAASAKLSPRPFGGVPEYAVDYRNSRMAVSPDGSRVAVLELNNAELEIVPLPGRNGAALPKTSLGTTDGLDALFGVVWLDDDTVLVIGSQPGGLAKGLPAGVVRWDLGLPLVDADGDRESALAAVPSGAGTVLVATSGGRVQTRVTPTGELRGEVAVGAPETQYDLARFSADGRSLALIDISYSPADATPTSAALRVVDTATGAVLHHQQWLDASDVAGLEFAGTTVLVTHLDGSVDILPDLGRGAAVLIATAGTRTSTGSIQPNPPVVGGGGLVGFPTRSGLQLYDLTTLQPSAALPVPPGFETVPRTYAFAPDGHTLVTGFFGADARTARVAVRDLDSGVVAAQVCASSGGSISSGEWRRVVGDAPPEVPGCR